MIFSKKFQRAFFTQKEINARTYLFKNLLQNNLLCFFLPKKGVSGAKVCKDQGKVCNLRIRGFTGLEKKSSKKVMIRPHL